MSISKTLIVGAVALVACRSDYSYVSKDLRATPPETFATNDPYTVYDMRTRPVVPAPAVAQSTEPLDRTGTAEESFSTSETYDGDMYAGTVREAGAPRYTGSFTTADREFVTQLYNGGRFEVQSSQLALQKGITGPHREFAETMIRDHGQVVAEIERIAQRQGLALPLELDWKHDAQLDELRQLDGHDFATRYHEIQMSGHENMVSTLENAVVECDDPEVKAVATKALSTARRHLEHLRDIGTPH